MKKLAVIIAVFLHFQTVQAQEDGILWKVSGNGLQKPSYLFGTIHYHCQPESINKPAVRDAIEATSKVALELDLGNMDVLISIYQHSLESSGTSLQLLLNDIEYNLVDSLCRLYIGDSLIDLDTKSPLNLTIQFMISKKFMECQGLPIDFTIVQMAKEARIETMGLETYRFQDSLMKSIPMDLQIKWLLDFCRDIKKAKSEFIAMTGAYDEQNSEVFYKTYFESSPESVYLNDALLVKRNMNWVKFLKNQMGLNPYFVAVGAAHLGGDKGLVRLLRDAGYTLTPIKF